MTNEKMAPPYTFLLCPSCNDLVYQREENEIYLHPLHVLFLMGIGSGISFITPATYVGSRSHTSKDRQYKGRSRNFMEPLQI